MLALEHLATDRRSGTAAMNRFSSAGTPFFFVVDAWASRWIVLDVKEADNCGFRWSLAGKGNLEFGTLPPRSFRFDATPVALETYTIAFDLIRQAQIKGETWLANLTFPTGIDTNLELEDFARFARSPFRLLVPGKFCVFSPERFVRIDTRGRIASYPMKGTIDADLPDAAERIMADEKESAEHVTIVDLIRNDLGQTARRVSVPRFRYLTEVSARGRRLLQVSSEVSGELGADWRHGLGDVMSSLLPAGSVTGAPKKRTIEVIQSAENYQRGWYTGVFGMFDGERLDSSVMIRFIERDESGSMVYKSGGGVTIYSNLESEYSELKAKVYAPFG